MSTETVASDGAKTSRRRNGLRRWFSEHIVASFATFGRQLAMFVEVFRTLIVDLFRGKFPFGEFIRQCAFISRIG